MSGNAMEEGLMIQIGNPSHTDPTRIGFLAGAIPAFGIIIFLPSYVPNITGFATSLIAVTVALVIGVGVSRRLLRKIAANEQAIQIARRARHEAETKRLLAEMKKENT